MIEKQNIPQAWGINSYNTPKMLYNLVKLFLILLKNIIYHKILLRKPHRVYDSIIHKSLFVNSMEKHLIDPKIEILKNVFYWVYYVLMTDTEYRDNF